MKIAIVLLLLLFFVLYWLRIDFRRGQKHHTQNNHNRVYPKRRGDLKLYTDGNDLFAELFKDIDQATKHVHVLFYIIRNDQFSQHFLDLLMRKARSGVEVRILIDWMGSRNISKRIIKELKKNGVHFSYSFTPKLPYLFYTSQKRNHRKITVIDGEIGYLGGLNIGKEYINQDPRLCPWRDYHLKMTGESIQDLQYEFLTDWYTATKEDYRNSDSYFPKQQPGSMQHMIVPTEGFGLEEIFTQFFHKAKNEIIIGTPYFIPSEALLEELRKLLKKGIKLTIIVPFVSDHPFVKEAAYRYFRILIKEGAHVLQFQNGFYHSKVLFIDNNLCDIGTANFDKRSLFLNHEVNCLIYDPSFLAEVAKKIQDDISKSTTLSECMLSRPTLIQSIKERIAYTISPFL
ncbi:MULTISPECIES: cardiolipin synthase [Bacillaceae]|uniref:Cardiolipin synthase n=1 Tax=Peribacillus huizhouensis TaxID=1501239 RepID=A0ABR6CSA7_9BACI|nr:MULTISPECIES: cardiolipin synthase [Bacillaceae]MBA9027907.1 cardiolipin synthase [Peribacillus huizhouensis]